VTRPSPTPADLRSAEAFNDLVGTAGGHKLAQREADDRRVRDIEASSSGYGVDLVEVVELGLGDPDLDQS
jgi:hypothetical protein